MNPKEWELLSRRERENILKNLPGRVGREAEKSAKVNYEFLDEEVKTVIAGVDIEEFSAHIRHLGKEKAEEKDFNGIGIIAITSESDLDTKFVERFGVPAAERLGNEVAHEVANEIEDVVYRFATEERGNPHIYAFLFRANSLSSLIKALSLFEQKVKNELMEQKLWAKLDLSILSVPM